MNKNTKKSPPEINIYLIIFLWISFAILLMLLFSKILEDRENPNQVVLSSTNSHDSVQISLQQNWQGHYIVNGKINDQTVVFFVDTGATSVSIPERIANQIGLKKGLSYDVSTANGTVKVYSTNLKSISIGELTLNSISANINPHMKSNEILLGMSFLKNLNLSQRDGVLTLTYP